MEANTRQEAFLKLRPPCVELSSVALKFRGNLAQPRDVLKALEAVYRILEELGSKEWLDEKLAEYAFFPLSHIFNQTQRLSIRCVELALRCLHILIEKGWRQRLSSAMGKQLMILMTILAGGPPFQNHSQTPSDLRSEELITAAFDCIRSLASMLQGREAAFTIFNEIGTATIVDQAVYVLLEGILDGPSDTVQMSAAQALQALNCRVTDRVVLASLLPRTVSTLTKTLRPTTQLRRSFKLLSCCLTILTHALHAVLNNDAVSSIQSLENDRKTYPTDGAIVLDGSWLKATASQIKLALANIIPLRSHEKLDVRRALLELCLVVIEKCSISLEDTLPMMIETVVSLAGYEEGYDALSALGQLVISSDNVLRNLKSSLHDWVIALPRVMGSNADAPKQIAIKHISTAFQVLAESGTNSELLDETMTSSLCESISAAAQFSSKAPQPLPSTPGASFEMILRDIPGSGSFQSILVDHRSQKGTFGELHCLIEKLSQTDTSLTLVRSIMDRLYGSSGNSAVAPFWLALSLLKYRQADTELFEDVLDIRTSNISVSRSTFIEELYSISLPLLMNISTANPEEWRILALALEAVALQAAQLGETFRLELIDTLYPVLELMGSSNSQLQDHAMTCLTLMTCACGYSDTSTMLIENVDYLINSVGMKFNTFDISPQAPQVLLMMIKLCGARLIPYLDDLIGSIFSVLDAYHGYPKLVELLFAVLGSIVDESAKAPSTLSICGAETRPTSHRKQQHTSTTISEIATEFKKRRERRLQHDSEEQQRRGPIEPHPKEPWKKSPVGDDELDEHNEVADNQADTSSEQPEAEVTSLSKPHNLLLSILKSIPPHLSSPSPHLRRSLLTILARGMTVLAPDENSFLPLINDIWPSVSSRITLPPTLASGSSTSLTLNNSSPVPMSEVLNDQDIQEQTYVIVASCKAIEAMCEGAGDFMSSRIEHEFQKWKRIYLRCWEHVKHDAEAALERHQRHQLLLNAEQQTRACEAISRLEQLEIMQNPSAAVSTVPKNLSAQTSIQRHQNSLLPYFASKTFSPHHNIWRALVYLFTTVSFHVRLPLDLGDDICHCLGEWISCFYPNRYFDYVWRYSNHLRRSIDDTSTNGMDVDETIRAMNAWNADLTWLIFVRGRGKTVEGGMDKELEMRRKRMNESLSKVCRVKKDSNIETNPFVFVEAAF
ncbi:hypothetical protein LOZ58_006291 [Ophidiomyces ophidiicola]|nr:hypothetical protein LOZ65_005408 [Ophidiomyces ophidiicola]KAI1956572.1 hypothetical protein LOZ58_006291 [Ophidiomyces ophidiicola]